MQLILKLQPNELITLTRLLTPKNKPFTLSLFYYSQPEMDWDFLFLTHEHKVDTIRTPNLHVYSLLDPMDTI